MIRDRTSARKIHWMLNLWPPFLFQGVRVREIDPEFRFAEVVVRKSILTRNIMGTTFGGALMAAADYNLTADAGPRAQQSLKLHSTINETWMQLTTFTEARSVRGSRCCRWTSPSSRR